MWFLDTPLKYASALAVMGAALLVWGLVSLVRGRIHIRQAVYEREENPLAFYFFILFLFALSAISFFAAAAFAFGTVT